MSSEAFKHSLDIQAEQALRSLPGFDLLARKFVEFIYERPQMISGMMLTHPFSVERVRYLKDWAVSPEYEQIKQGNDSSFVSYRKL
ncbi:Zn-dependent protease with chaperone function [Richelia intracellularis]|nr:Zn-dependent protease with chaperone function [Richelia intracellularis]